MEVENCPICGAKMEEGYISTTERVWWSKNRPSMILRGDEVLGGSFIKGLVSRANRCPSCKIVLFSYENAEKSE